MNAVYDFFVKEWYFSIPLVCMSLVAAALVLWRLLLNNTANTDLDDFLPVFQQTLRKGGIKAAVDLCKEEKGLIPNRLFVAGLEASEQGAAAMRRSMANENELEIIPRLHFLLALILAIAKIATMVGLFFTVISMINTFNAIGEQASSGKAKEIGGHASKIGLALFATALGAVHRDPAGVQPRAVQGVDRELPDQGEGLVAETHHAGDQLQEGPEAARRERGASGRGRGGRPQGEG